MQQLPLPAGWATRLQSNRDPRDELAAIERAQLNLKAAIRAELDRSAERFGISGHEVTAAVTGYVDDLLADLFYETRSRLQREVEDGDPV